MSAFSPRRIFLLFVVTMIACASSGSSGDGAASADGAQGVDCSELKECSDGLKCSGGTQCFKLKSCPGFVCTSPKVACQSDCGGGAKCLVLESSPMMLNCH